jgi:AraC-like DNA-binding protein
MPMLMPISCMSSTDPNAAATLTDALRELVWRVSHATIAGDGIHITALPALQLVRISAPTPCTPTLYEPRLCVVVQGSKTATLGNQHYRYDPLHYLAVSMTLPMIGQVIEASAERPYLCLRLDIDPAGITELLRDNSSEAAVDGTEAAFAARISAPLLDAVLRLMRLLDTPDDLAVLAPLAIREIYYRVLQGDLGGQLRAIVLNDGQPQRIAQAVNLLREHYHAPLRMEKLARNLHMSVSALHHRFKSATAMSPLQYQKQLRLHEARRLMLLEGLAAASAAHRVGYQSPSQFSREYKRLFGRSPRAEVAQVRGEAP